MSLSTKPPAFDKGNPTGTVKDICNYLATLYEELDFTLKQLQKQLDSK